MVVCVPTPSLTCFALIGYVPSIDWLRGGGTTWLMSIFFRVSVSLGEISPDRKENFFFPPAGSFLLAFPFRRSRHFPFTKLSADLSRTDIYPFPFVSSSLSVFHRGNLQSILRNEKKRSLKCFSFLFFPPKKAICEQPIQRCCRIDRPSAPLRHQFGFVE